MNINIEVTVYKVVGCKDAIPAILDWVSLGIEKDFGVLKTTDTQLKEYQLPRCEVTTVANGSEILLQSSIYIPCSVMHKDIKLLGSFYRYISNTTFQTPNNVVSQVLISEMYLYHFGRVFWYICEDSKKKTPDGSPYFIETKCLGAILLNVERKYGTSI